MSESWDGIDRRKSMRTPTTPDGTDGDLWRYMIQQFEMTNAKLNAIHLDMVGHKADLQHLHTDVEAIKKAFPKDDEGSRDFDGHRDHHDGLIRTSKRWSDIGNDVLKKLFSGLAWVTVVFIALSIWSEIKRRLGVHD